MNYFQKFLHTDTRNVIQSYRTESDARLQATGRRMALALFRQAVERVPAYKKFLQKHRIRPASVKTFDDFLRVPVTDKPTYIDVYPVNELCWDGKLESSYFLSASSGSTGQPYFWPRSAEQTYQGARISEALYTNFFGMHKTATLYIDAFAMGMWIAGTYMQMATVWVAEKGMPLTIATPGLAKEDIVRLIAFGAKQYDQIVLMGYPPFIKDVIDTSIERGIDWSKIRAKFLFSGEAFTERWRDHIQQKTKFSNILTDAINIYGSADVGLIAHETPTSIYIRRKAAEMPDVRKALFGGERVPSLCQFDPALRFFEQVGDELVVTARSGIPLVRYNMKDVGNVVYFDDAMGTLHTFGIDAQKDFRKAELQNMVWRLPFVYLFGRGKFTATLYGITIFPEYIKYVLDHESLEKILTGKFIISTEETKDHEQELHFHVERKDGVAPNVSHERLVIDSFIDQLPKISSEYKHLLANIQKKAHPKVFIHEYGDPDYFPRGIIKKTA